MIGYYVTIKDGPRTCFALGPFSHHAESLAQVDRVREYVCERDNWAWFYGFGTTKITTEKALPVGKLNSVLMPVAADLFST